jgi:hypothetical protein
MDIGKTLPLTVPLVPCNVPLVKEPPKIVSPVLVTELMPQPVTAQSTLLKTELLPVHLVHVNVNNVTSMVTVLNVLLTETTYQLVDVFLITLKLWFKTTVSVKFVTLDVLNVLMFSINVLVVLPIL